MAKIGCPFCGKELDERKLTEEGWVHVCPECVAKRIWSERNG